MRIFISNGSGNKEVIDSLDILKLIIIPGVDREQPAEDTDGADHQGHRVCHHRHICPWHAGDEELHEGEGEEEGGA